MAELQGSKLEGLSEITATPTSQLKFITDAWAQARARCPGPGPVVRLCSDGGVQGQRGCRLMEWFYTP